MLTYEEKFLALNKLDPSINLKMDKNKYWYVSSKIELAGDGFLSSIVGSGITPEHAINNFWFNAVENVAVKMYLTIGGSNSYRENYIWNGISWKLVQLNSK